MEGLIGGVLGGIFRLAPEVFKMLDKKNERKHELALMQNEKEIAIAKGELAIRNAEIDYSTHQLDAISEAFKEQSTTAQISGKFVSALSAMVRPVVTYWFVAIYSAVKISSAFISYQQGARWSEAIQMLWSSDDVAILNFILTFWFVGRSIEKYNK